MIGPLTQNTQAILLLTAPLLTGRGHNSPHLLSHADYNRFARSLREMQKQPADLIGPDSEAVLECCAKPLGRERLESLLGRGFLLSQVVEKWNARAIWVISRADSMYPKRLRVRLKEDAPPLLYGCGESGLLERGGLAVVGSRHVDDELITYTEGVGRLSAEARRVVVSGGARGIDRAAMNGALAAGGDVIGVLADSLEKAALSHDNREALREGRLALISPYDPAAGFNVGHAMQRNKLIYALADAALVVNSDYEKGGTWAGAVEQLDRLRYVPVFVRDGAKVPRGNSALLLQGGRPWPNPMSVNEFENALAPVAELIAAEPKQIALPLAVREISAVYESAPVPLQPTEATRTTTIADTSLTPDKQLIETVRRILVRELAHGHTEEEVSVLMGVLKSQAKLWLATLVQESLVEKVPNSKPVRFRTVTHTDRLL